MISKSILKQISDLAVFFQKKTSLFRKVRLPLRNIKDLWQLPVMTRQELLLFVDRGLVRDPFNVTATSGSTNARLFVAHSLEAYQAHVRRLTKLYRSVVGSSGGLCLNLCSYGLNSGGRLMEAAYKGAGVGVIPFGQIRTNEDMEEAVRAVKCLKPTIVNAYTNQLFELFSMLGKRHSFKKCIVNGEPLFVDYKKQIEIMGGVRIYDHYGAMEVSGFAIAQRPDDAYMKVFDEDLFLEVLKEDGSFAVEGRGVLVVTDLNNRSMPFIRYKLGDVVEIIKKDGASWIRVLGREEDSILINGVVVIKRDMIEIVQKTVRCPEFFFVVDKDRGTYKDRVVLNVHKKDMARVVGVADILRKVFEIGRCVQVKEFMGDIPRTSTGKVRFFIDGRNSRK